jgi:hypothetical protein
MLVVPDAAEAAIRDCHRQISERSRVSGFALAWDDEFETSDSLQAPDAVHE